MGWGPSWRSGNGQVTLGEVQDGSGDDRGCPNESGYPRGGPNGSGYPRGDTGQVRRQSEGL